MKTIVVCSDTHGDENHLKKILSIPADYYIHCGDHEYESKYNQSFYMVKGNNDLFLDLPSEINLTIEGVKIHIEHGHYLGRLNPVATMSRIMKEEGYDLFLYGHSHIPAKDEMGQLLMINPGSTSEPRKTKKGTYCIITIDEKKINVKFSYI